MNNLFAELAKPFPPQEITWKPGHTTKDGNKCMAMAYADMRAYMDRLDEVCGMEWSVEYRPWGDGRIIAYLTIHGVTRCSTGEMNAQDEKNGMGGTVAEAQAMKRAAAMFGLGRYLYDLPAAWVGYDSQSKKISKDGQNELDKRYRDWYNRMMAASAKRNTQANDNGSPGPDDNDRPTIDPATGEILGDGDVENPWNDDAPAPASEKAKTLSQAQLTRLNMLGVDFYKTKKEWDLKRPELVKAATTGAKSSSKELLPAEADLLIRGLEKRIRERDEAAQKRANAAAQAKAAQQPAMAAAA